jgi:hypothetical protein
VTTPSSRGQRAGALTLLLILVSAFFSTPALATDSSVPLDQEDPAATPQIWVSKTSDLNPLGEEVTVIGRGFLPGPGRVGTRAPLAGQFSGAYVVFGKFADVWQPTAKPPRGSRTVDDQRWAVNPDQVDFIGGEAAGAIAINANGTFQTTLLVRATFDGMPDRGNLGIFTFAGSGAEVAEFETEHLVSFTPSRAPLMAFSLSPVEPQPDQPFTLTVITNPSNAEGSLSLSRPGLPTLSATLEEGRASFSLPPLPGGRYIWDVAFTPDQPLVFSATTQGLAFTLGQTVLPDFQTSTPSGAGFLRWGVKASFREYVSGPIAQGSIDLAGAGRSGSQFIFGQSQSVESLSELTTINYGGGVRFLGHSGVLNVSLANPRITIISPQTAILSVEVGGNRISMASLNLQAARITTTDTFVSYDNVPATLLASGQSVFSFQGTSFYQAGEALDPVSFGVGGVSGELPAAVLFDAFTPEDPEFAEDSAALGAAAALEGSCQIAEATLTWGFKESFRSYISSTIAKGEWSVSEGATYETPEFSFSHTHGSLNPDIDNATINFGGTVSFTGHDGVLNTTISNPRFVTTGPDTAILSLDISGTTMEGVEVARTNVAFAAVDLTGATTEVNGSTITITQAPATLTPDGARAFGTYPAGSSLDPISVQLLKGLECDTAVAAGGSATDQAFAGVSWRTTGLIGSGALLVGAGGAWWLTRTLQSRPGRLALSQ